jgi:hypothetical protein
MFENYKNDLTDDGTRAPAFWIFERTSSFRDFLANTKAVESSEFGLFKSGIFQENF